MSEISKINEYKYLNDIISNKTKISSINHIINQNSIKKVKILDYICFVKIIAAYAVIILHTNKFSFYDFKNNKNWVFNNFIEQFFYFGVPFFVLCIGATLLDFNEKYGLTQYYKRRFLKVVLPLIGWNIISYYYRIYFVKNLKREKFNVVNLLNIYFQNKLYGLFYSFHIFITTYMIIPLLAFVEKRNKIKIYFYCFFTLLITQSFVPYIIEILNINLAWPYKVNVGYIIYIFSGYIIQNYLFSSLIKILIYITGLFFFLIQLISTHVLTYRYGKVIFRNGYLRLPVILYCNSLFLFIKENCHFLYKLVNKETIKKLGTLTIGPFFLHWPVIDFFHKYPKLIFNMNIFTFYGGTFICITCFILTMIFKKIPLINYLFP